MARHPRDRWGTSWPAWSSRVVGIVFPRGPMKSSLGCESIPKLGPMTGPRSGAWRERRWMGSTTMLRLCETTPPRRDLEVRFDPVRGRELAGRRPAVFVSDDIAKQGTSDQVTVVPIVGRDRSVRSHAPVRSPEGGPGGRSRIICEQARVFAVERLLRRHGWLSAGAMAAVAERFRLLVDLEMTVDQAAPSGVRSHFFYARTVDSGGRISARPAPPAPARPPRPG